MAAEETVNFVLWLKRTKRLAEATIAGKLECLRNLAKRVDLWDSEAVEDVVRETPNWGNAYKNRVLYAYQDWLRFHGFEYTFNLYYVNFKLPYVRTIVLLYLAFLAIFKGKLF